MGTVTNYWFTSDLHFGHTNVIKYAKRPFLNAAGEPDVEMMNAALIKNWNDRVQHNDMVYVLGDFAAGIGKTPWVPLDVVRQLNGHKHLIFGNHDHGRRKDREFLSHFVWAKDLTEIKVPTNDGGQSIVLCHFAMRTWNKSHYGTWQLYGHSHGNLADDPNMRSLDVGVDCWNYAPVHFDQIRERMAQKRFVPVDHHRSNM
jgi:calcineurin-like phosphoesterase family protein